jgi:hypothetical protein
MCEQRMYFFGAGLKTASVSASFILFFLTPALASGWQDDIRIQTYFIWSIVGLICFGMSFLVGGIMSAKSFVLMLLPIDLLLMLLAFVVGSTENLFNRLSFAVIVVVFLNVVAAIGLLSARRFHQQNGSDVR